MDNGGFAKFVKQNWFGFVSIGISITMLIIYLIKAGGINELADSFAYINKFWLAGMVICMLAFWLADGSVLHVYVAMKYKNHSYIKSLKTTMIGLLYNNLTPFGTGGQPMQVYDLTLDNVSAGDAVSFVMVKTLLYQMCLIVYAAAVLIFTFGFFRERIPHLALLMWAGVCINVVFITAVCAVSLKKAAAEKIAAVIVRLLAALRIVKNRGRVTELFNMQITRFNRSFTLLFQKRDKLILGFLLTVLQQTLYYCLPYCIYRGFNMSGVSFALILSAQAIFSLIMTFVPIPGGSGVAESGFYLFYELFFTQGDIMPAVFLWRFLTYYSTIIVGGAVGFYDSHRRGKSIKTSDAKSI